MSENFAAPLHPAPLPPSPPVDPTLLDVAAEPEPGPVTPEPPLVSKGFIAGLVAATFGVMMALILPTAFSLSVVLDRIAPGRESVLGGIVAAGSFAGMVVGPAIGVWSDRTRSRFGRRRPFLLGGLAVGLAGLVTLGLAPNLALLYVGWIVTQWGLGTTASALVNIQADKLPEAQRGKVAGMSGVANMAAPILGVGIASAVVDDQLLLFLIPGAVACVCVLLFGIVVKDPDTRAAELPAVSFATVAGKYVFNPRKHPQYGWNWLGRAFFFMGMTSSTVYTTFYFAQKLDMAVAEVAGIIAIISLVGVAGGMVGGLGSGFLSDRFKRRRIFILFAAASFAVGTVVIVLAPSVGLIVVGLLITNLGIGAFSAVDQAIVLDILPERETDAGRYMALMSLSQGIPGVIAPAVAGVVITIGASEGWNNYGLLYLLSAAYVVIGATLIFTKVKSVR